MSGANVAADDGNGRTLNLRQAGISMSASSVPIMATGTIMFLLSIDTVLSCEDNCDSLSAKRRTKTGMALLTLGTATQIAGLTLAGIGVHRLRRAKRDGKATIKLSLFPAPSLQGGALTIVF